ncbi:hypothetical protein SAMN05216404_1081, partial [Nitrosospira multiformis]
MLQFLKCVVWLRINRLSRILPYLASDKLLDLSVWRGVVFTGLWVCKVLVE